MSGELLAALLALTGPAGDWLMAAGLVFLRVGAAMAALPAFGDQGVPARVRLGLGLAFTLAVLPAVADGLPRPEGSALALVILGEAAVGLAFGLLLRFLIFALQTAGTIAAQSTSLAQIMGGGPGGEASPAIGHLLTAAALALAAAAGLHVQVALYLIESYALVPAGALFDPGDLLQAGLGEAGRAMGLALTLSAPFVAASLLYNLALGVVSRAMPQLMVTFIGAPALTLASLGLLLLAAPALLDAWQAALLAFLDAPFAP